MKNVKILLSAILIFSVFMPIFADDKSVIKIEQAQKSEYKKDSESKTDIIVLTGNVVVSIVNGETNTKISADQINFNREKNMIYAEGNVNLSQSNGEDSKESITAKSLLFNTATLEGVFDNGKVIQSSSSNLNLPSGSSVIVSSKIFGRDSDGTVAFKSGNLTFCNDENPHWKIHASRIWLLPGGEFAFFNAVLYVGYIPLFWIPIFYYPKDELVFNPAFGYKKRTGYFFNTTTYLYGRKSSNSVSKESSNSSDKVDFFSLIETDSLKNQKREGLVLHNLNSNFTGDTTHYVKIMADYYENLGIMTGVDGKIAPGDYLTNFDFNTELGFSNTIFENSTSTDFSPYNSVGEKSKDTSNFMSYKMPFRYQANLNMTFSKPFYLNLSIPIYSDPFFSYDFNDRVETMDWIDYAMNGGKTTEDESEDENPSSKEISTFSWDLKGNYSVPIPDSVQPYVSRIDITDFSSSITYSSKATSSEKLAERDEYKKDSSWADFTPERKFYYPSQIMPFKISSSISGDIIKYPKDKNYSKKKTEIPNLTKIDEFKTPEEKEKDSKTEDKKNEIKKDIVFDENFLPDLNIPSYSVRELSDISYNLNYSINPDFSSQFSYEASQLNSSDDFDWNDMQSTYVHVKSPVTLTSNLGYKDGFISLSDSFTFNPVFQKHPYLKEEKFDDTGNSNGGYSESSIKSIKNADYGAKKLDVTNNNDFTIKPFCYTDYFSKTSLAWKTTVKMVETKYISTDPDEPEWEYLTMELWSKDCVTTHDLVATLAAEEYNGKLAQSLVLTSSLPPQNRAYHETLTFEFPYVTFTCSTGMKEVDKTDSSTNEEYKEWMKEDFSQALTIKLLDSKLNFTQNYIYDFEEEEPESLRFSLSGYGAQLAYTASYVSGYEFESGMGWKLKSDSEKKFQPYQASFAFTNSSRTYRYWSERVAFAPLLSTSVVYDFLRPTSSYFIFKPGITFRINDFLNISFTSESRNDAIYRYFCSNSDFEYYYLGFGERNIFKDLQDSFKLNDDKARRASSFKLKNFNITISHDIHDWDFNCEFSISPRYISETKSYDYSPYFSASVTWRPMPSIKTKIEDKYGEWNLQ